MMKDQSGCANADVYLRNTIWMVLCMFFFGQGCASEKAYGLKNVKISFDVDSFRVYPSSDIQLTQFIFNPVTGYDQIWILNYPNPYELDLTSGTWTPLTEKYGEDFKRGLQERNIWKDSLTGEVFIHLGQEGLVHYDSDHHFYAKYPIHPVTDILNTKDVVITGNPDGLYFIYKKDKSISLAPGFSFDYAVNDISVYKADSLRINQGALFYQTVLNRPGRMTRHIEQLLYPANNGYLDMLPRDTRESRYTIHHDGQLHFYYSVDRLFFQDSTKTLFEIERRPAGDLRQIRTDDVYLYLLYKDAFVIMHKTYAVSNAVVFDLEAYYAITKRYLENELQKLVMYNVDSFLLHYDRLKEDSILKTWKGLEMKFNEYTVNFLTYLETEHRYKDIESLVLKDSIPPELEKYALVGLCRYYLKTYRLDKVKLYSSRLSAEYPGFSHEGSHSILDCALRISHSIDSLKMIGLDEDEFLYNEALLKQELVYCGWTGDNYYDFTIVSDNYSQLLSRFPKSDFADDAEYYFIAMQSSGDEGYQYSPEQIKDWNRFIKKYPDSDLVSRARIQIARNYEAYYGTVDEMIEMKEKALAELQKINVVTLTDTNLVNNINSLKKDISKQIKQMAFDLEFRIPKKEYYIGEEIVCTVVLRNKTSKIQQIGLYANGPGYVTTLYPGHVMGFIPERVQPDTSMKLVTVLPMDSLVQEINLTQRVRLGETAETGKYFFKQSGLYHIGMHVPNLLHSKQVQISVYTRKE